MFEVHNDGGYLIFPNLFRETENDIINCWEQHYLEKVEDILEKYFIINPATQLPQKEKRFAAFFSIWLSRCQPTIKSRRYDQYNPDNQMYYPEQLEFNPITWGATFYALLMYCGRYYFYQVSM